MSAGDGSPPDDNVVAPPPPRSSALRKAVVLVGAGVLGGVLVVGRSELQSKFKYAIFYIETLGETALLAYLVITCVGVVALFPTTPMEFAGGFLFAPRYGLVFTWVLVCCAKLVANIISVAIARHLLRDWIFRTFVEKSELLTLVSQAVREEPFKMAFLVRGSMVPVSVKNYGLGVLDIGYLPIFLCSCIFTPFYAIQNMYFGSLCQDLADVFSSQKPTADATGGLASTLKTGLPIAFNVFLVLALVRAIRHQLKKKKDALLSDLKAKTPKAE